MVCSSEGFPKLESLSICFLHSLEKWESEEGALHSLRSLYIKYCKTLSRIPDGLRYIITPKEIVIQLYVPGIQVET